MSLSSLSTGFDREMKVERPNMNSCSKCNLYLRMKMSFKIIRTLLEQLSVGIYTKDYSVTRRKRSLSGVENPNSCFSMVLDAL